MANVNAYHEGDGRKTLRLYIAMTCVSSPFVCPFLPLSFMTNTIVVRAQTEEICTTKSEDEEEGKKTI